MRRFAFFLSLAACFSVISVSLASNAGAEVTVFGVAMKQPLPFGECAFSEIKVPKRGQAILGKSYLQYTVHSPSSRPCYERTLIGSAAPLDHESVAIKFPIGDEPTLSKHGQLAARLIDGRVERLWFWTKGLRHQQVDMDALTAKFGAPSANEVRAVSNAFGATFTSINAGWDLPDGIKVTYASTTGTIDTGMFVASTAIGEQSFQAAVGAATRRGREL